jgi:hypothetical protein
MDSNLLFMRSQKGASTKLNQCLHLSGQEGRVGHHCFFITFLSSKAAARSLVSSRRLDPTARSPTLKKLGGVGSSNEGDHDFSAFGE